MANLRPHTCTIIVMIALTMLTGAIPAAGQAPSSSQLTPPVKMDAALPELRIGLGMPLAQVKAQSSFPISLDGLYEDSPILIARHLELTYVHPLGASPMGRSSSVRIEQMGGLVVELKASIQDQPLPLAVAHRHAQFLAESIANQGWRPAPGSIAKLPSVEQLEGMINQRAKCGAFILPRLIGEWQMPGANGPLYLSMTLEHPAQKHITCEPLPGFIVQLRFADPRLHAIQQQRVHEIRQRNRLPAGEKLPLSAL